VGVREKEYVYVNESLWVGVHVCMHMCVSMSVCVCVSMLLPKEICFIKRLCDLGLDVFHQKVVRPWRGCVSSKGCAILAWVFFFKRVVRPWLGCVSSKGCATLAWVCVFSSKGCKVLAMSRVDQNCIYTHRI